MVGNLNGKKVSECCQDEGTLLRTELSTDRRQTRVRTQTAKETIKSVHITIVNVNVDLQVQVDLDSA